MVKGISAVDAIYGSTRKATKTVFQKLKDNKEEILMTGVGVAGIAAYGTAFANYVKGG